ncbi:MAG: DUF3467 domain-containing protein [Candidatus Odinarchaeia archaeon]
MEKEKNVPKEIRFIYREGAEFKRFYVTGARGVIEGGYHFRLDFYVDRVRLPEEEVIKEGKLQGTSSEPEVLTVDREYQTGVILSYRALKQLSEWLNRKVKEFESVLKKEEEI